MPSLFLGVLVDLQPYSTWVTISGSNIGATTEANENVQPDCNGVATSIGATVWCEVRLPTNAELVLTTIHDSTNFDTVVGLWANKNTFGSPTGPGDLNLKTCADDIGSGRQSATLSASDIAITTLDFSVWVPATRHAARGSNFVLSMAQSARRTQPVRTPNTSLH